jgi:hypothetical protein
MRTEYVIFNTDQHMKSEYHMPGSMLVIDRIMEFCKYDITFALVAFILKIACVMHLMKRETRCDHWM